MMGQDVQRLIMKNMELARENDELKAQAQNRTESPGGKELFKNYLVAWEVMRDAAAKGASSTVLNELSKAYSDAWNKLLTWGKAP